MRKTGGRRDQTPDTADAAVVRAVFEEQFGPGLLVDLEVTPDLDHYGDPVLDIYLVIHDAMATKLDPKIMVGFIRHLRDRLTGDAFPIPRYISASDFASLSNESV